ncbi:L-iditol 2-dehydrogenase [Phycisphaerales bacterium]|nr:L-iditol 2-dehydrogenase [Phycisphaerales bacterium]
MKAVVFEKSVRVEERGEPLPAPGDALVRPLLVGIASPDLAVIAGRVAFSGVLGHEFVGTVERVEADAAERKRWEGKRVVGTPWIPCAACELCSRGLSAQCQERRVLGLHRRDGCFADRFTIPAANLVEIPKAVSDEAAVFAGVIGGAVHAARIARFEGKPYVTVLGDGPTALITAQVLAKLNASVRVLGTNPEKFSLCEKWGIRHRPVSEVGKRRDQDVVVDCTGAAEGLELAMQLARPRGTVIARSAPAPVPLTGLVNSVKGVDLSPAVCNELHVVGAGAGSIRDGVEALARGAVDVASLISRKFRLGEAVEAIAWAKRPEALRVVMG